MDPTALRSTFKDVLSRLLSADLNERKLAETQLQALQVMEEYGVILCELTLSPHEILGLRQMTAVLLRQYVDTHWNADADKFAPPEATPEAKATIRRLIPEGLKESISKIRSSVAYIVSTIAHWDWPEQWPDIFDLLTNALQDSNEFAVMGSVRVLKEFSRDLTDAQLPLVAPSILPDIYRIFMEPDKYSVRTRARAVEIFTTLLNIICESLNGPNRSSSKSLLGPILPTFTEALVRVLSVSDESHETDPGLKTEVLKALTALVKSLPKSMFPWLSQILPAVWSTLTSSAVKYVSDVVNSQSGDGAEDQAVDSDGEVIGFENLVFAIFEFVHALVETPKFKGAVKAGLSDLMYYIVLYMQITDDQLDKWLENPEHFIEDEDEDSFSYSVRLSSQELLKTLCSEFEKECCVALAQTIERHIRECEELRMRENATWWKGHEASMLALGGAYEILEGQFQEANPKFDLRAFLENIVLADISTAASPFLLGRCLWVASKFPSHLSDAALTRFVEACVCGLQPSQPPVVRISAVRSAWGLCSHVTERGVLSASLLTQALPAILDAITSMCAAYSGSADVLGVVLENLPGILSCDSNVTASYEAKIAPLAIAIFLQYSGDPVLTALVQDTFKVLSQNEGCLTPLQTRLLPTLVSILDAQGEAVSPGLQSVALDVLQTLVRSSAPPLSEGLVVSAFPASVRCTLRTDDNTIMQSGGECLRAYISQAPQQVAAYCDSEGKTGLWYSVQVAGHLLNPMGSEFTATFVGRLITTLMRKVGDQLGENLDLLLKSVLSKLRGSQTLTVIQSLLMVYAQLIHSQLSAVMNFLSSVPGPSGESALCFVLTEWVSRQHVFYGAYESKVTLLALAKLLQHGVVSNDLRLQEITVNGDLVAPKSSQSRTRAQTRANPDQWTRIPLLVKIFKLLVSELGTNLDVLASAQNHESDDDSVEEGDDDEWEDEDNDAENGVSLESAGVELSKLLGTEATITFCEEEDEDDDEDPDALADPIYKINLRQYLTEYLHDFCRQPYFPTHFAQHLTAEEKKSLTTIGIPV